MEIFFTILILTIIVPISGIINKILPINFPLPIIQILIGSILSYLNFGLNINFNPDLFLVLFIPPLLFFDGLNIDLEDFFKNFIEIILLSLFLVIITIIIVGILIYFLIPNILFIESIMLSSVLSPTDVVSLISLIGYSKIPKKIINIIKGEALMNDASGLSSLRCAIFIYSGYMVFNISNITKEFLKVSFGGILIGILIIFLYNIFLKLINKFNANDDTINIILLIILPFLSYLLSEHFGFSGILSSVISGMTLNKFKLIGYSCFNTKSYYKNFWKTLEFILNGIVFIMLGIQIPIIYNNILLCNKNINILLIKIFVIYNVIIILRFIWIYLIKKINSLYIKKENFLFLNYNLYDILIASFSGVRGSITLAGVLSIPMFIDINLRNEFIFISIGVILLSLFIGSIVLPLLIKINSKKNSIKYINIY